MKTVLVVDDEPAVRAVVRAILHDEGYAVLEAAHGRAMLDVLARERADLVLMDVMMPGGDGREAFDELRAREDLPDVPVVMMSAAIRPEGLNPAIAAFVRKPFDLDQLLDLIARLIGPAHAGQSAPIRPGRAPGNRTTPP